MMWFRRIYVHIDSIVIVWLHVSWVTFLHLQGKLDELKRADAHPNNLGHPFANVSAKHSREIWFFQTKPSRILRSWICASAPCIPCRAASWQTRSATARRRDWGRRWGQMKRMEESLLQIFFLLFCYVGLFDICLVCLISSLVCWLVGLLVS